jgi:hypothetical protein
MQPRSAKASSRGVSGKWKASCPTAQIIDPKLLDADGRCVFGATVELEDLDTGDTVTYQIVGDDEADIKDGKIAISSPIARALIGKFAGDVAEVQAPGGVRELGIDRRSLRLTHPVRCIALLNIFTRIFITLWVGALVGHRLSRCPHPVSRPG